jgi:phosphoribosylanthranilate isomerase
MKLKVCGLTDPDQAVAVARLGASWIGLNFHPPSPRFVTEAQARAIVAVLPAGCEPVGLFVNRPAAEVAERARSLNLPIVQLHGDEPPDDVAALAGQGLRVVRAFRLATVDALRDMADFAMRCEALGAPLTAVLADAFVAGQAGGTGRTIAPEVLDALADWPPALPPLILAGGLTPDNVAELSQRVRPWMLDVASGVESAPGCKDLDRVERFVAASGVG